MSLQLPSEAGHTPEKFMVLFIHLFIYFPRYAFASLPMDSPFAIPLDPQEEQSPIFGSAPSHPP